MSSPLRRWAGRALLASSCLLSVAFADTPVTIRFTVWDGDVSLGIIKGLLAQFELENPGIRVKLEPIPDYAMYHQKMLVEYAANVAPDVAMNDMGHFNALSKRGALLPLNDFMARTPGFDIRDYYEPIVKAHSSGGKLYVLPRDIAPMGLIYYNKRLFDKAGIPYPDGTWTWDFKERPELKEKDFIWVCRQLTKWKSRDPRKAQWGFASGWPELLARTFALETGVRLADDPEHPTKVNQADPRNIRAYQYAADFMNVLKYMPNSTETSNSLNMNTEQLFVAQKIAMFQNGIWEVPNIRRDLPLKLKDGTPNPNFFEWDITLFPAYADGTRAAPTGGSGYAIFSSTRYPEQSWKLVKFMAGPVGMAAMAKAGIAQPAIRKLALTKDVWLPGPNTPKEQFYPPSRVFTDKAVQYVVFDPTADYWPDVSDRMASGIELLWNGQAKADEVLKRSAQRGQERLNAKLKFEKLGQYNWLYGVAAGLVIAAVILFWVYWPERKVRYTSREKKESRSAYLFASPWLIGMVVFTLGPMILSLLMSFADWDIIQPAKWRGVDNYREAFGGGDPVVIKSLIVTTIYTVVSVPLGLIGALLLALLLNIKVRGVALFRAVYYLPSLTSLMAASLIWRKIFNPDNGILNAAIYGLGDGRLGGWLNHTVGIAPGKQVDWLGMESTALPALIIMSLWGIGGGMVILLAGLQGIPNHYYEAATLDGAGALRKFRNVTLPLLTPTIFFSLITGLIGSFLVFTQALVMTGGGPNDSTRFFMFYLYQQAFQSIRMGYASALAWVLFFIIMAVTLIQMKFRKWVFYEADVR
jgi:ABC-type sugar transport system permease subunit/ABC-type glycerol-3-phosphate transport system substrate-binding protein